MSKGITSGPEEVGKEQKTAPCGSLSRRVALGLLPNSCHHLGCTQALGFESEYADPVYPISAVWEELEKSILLSFFFSLKNLLTKALHSSKDQLFALCRGPGSHLILQWHLELLCPSCEPLDCSSSPHLSPLHFLVGFEVFLYFSIFYTDAILVKAWCKQIERRMSAAEILSAYGTQMCSLSYGSHRKTQKPTREEGCHSFIWHILECFLCVRCITIKQCQNRWDLWTKKDFRDHLRRREWEPGGWSGWSRAQQFTRSKTRFKPGFLNSNLLTHSIYVFMLMLQIP